MASKKAINQRRHAKRRAFERYGLSLNRDHLRELARKIQRNDGRFLQHQSLRVSIWELLVEGKLCRVVYDKERKQVISFLPLTDSVEYVSLKGTHPTSN